MGEHYLAVTAEFTNTSGVVSYSADTLVMKWFGEYLDIVDRLPTTGARAVTAFAIGSTQYLAVANHVDNFGEFDSICPSGDVTYYVDAPLCLTTVLTAPPGDTNVPLRHGD